MVLHLHQRNRAKTYIKIDYPGTGNFSSFTYDGLQNRAKIVETRNNAVTSTLQFVFCGSQMCEERDGSGNLTKQFFALGQTTSGTTNKYFYSLSTREDICTVTDISGNNQAQISYSPWGQSTVLSGGFSPDSGYAGMYSHAPSGLNLTWARAYSPAFGRWLSRDLLEETVGTNLYGYVDNEPIRRRDPLGLCKIRALLTHVTIIFEDNPVGPTGPLPTNAGFYWGGVGYNSEFFAEWGFDLHEGHLDDAMMRQAVNEANESGMWQPQGSGPNGWCVKGHNCQDYVKDVLRRYTKKMCERCSSHSNIP